MHASLPSRAMLVIIGTEHASRVGLIARGEALSMQANSFQRYLESLHRDYAGIDTGTVASYIPELLRADPAWFGIALMTVDGHVYQAGDSRQSFTIQSISKAITYGLALEDQGIEKVLRKVDVEPSGEAFNSISLEPGTGRPRNPMINAGAIATVALVNGDTPAEKFARMEACYERYLGRRVSLDEDVYRSEKSSGHRNRAIAYLLHHSDILERTPDDILDVYFKQCSLLVTCRDLGQRRRESHYRRARAAQPAGRQSVERDDVLWHVRLLRCVDVRGWHAG